MSYNIDNAKNDIQNLQDQNKYDFQEIKRLNILINDYAKRVTQAININNQLYKKIQSDYEKIKKIILDENVSATLDKKIDDKYNSNKSKIEEINKQLDKKINDKYYSNNSKIEELTEQLDKKINDKYNSNKSEIEELNEQLDNIANKGTTVEVLERVTKEEINRQIEDGTITNLTIADNSITWDKFKNELKSNINQLVKNTIFNNDGSVKEIFTDNKYKITTFENNVVNEKWYTSANKLLFTKTTTLNEDGSFSESLI